MNKFFRIALVCLVAGSWLGAHAQTGSTAEAGGAPVAARAAEAVASSSRKMSSKETERKALFWFRLLDTNKSGSLSRDEIRGISALNKEFDNADTNGDGEVTEAEIRALSKKRVDERRARKAREKAQAEAASSAAAAAAP